MSEEEKRINYLLDTIIECPSMQADELRKKIRRLFKTIEKKQKEIEELKQDNEHQWEERCKLTFELDNCISKDKIREKIGFYKKYGKIKNSNEYVMSEEIEVLEGLIGEDNKC